MGSAIRLPDSLEGSVAAAMDRLFRGWDLQRADREKALPQVPEAVTQPRFPGVVNRVHQILCALAALLFVLVGKIEQYSGASDDPNLAQIAAAVGALWWGLLARRLLRRSQPEAIFARDYKIGWVATAIAVSLCGYTMATQGRGIGRVLLVVAFLVAAYVWLSRQRKGLAFWLPQERAGRESRAEPRAVPELAHPDRVARHLLVWYWCRVAT